MKIGLLPFGKINETVLLEIQQGLVKVFPDAKCSVIKGNFQVNEKAFDKKRNQYNSGLILNQVNAYAEKKHAVQRVLGVVDVDLFVPELNYVFGEAYVSGKAALISLFRLKSEFYHEEENQKLFLERSVKEAVHEVGHTLGLNHCLRETCVMHFSNSIFDTDKKQSLFCDQCYLQAAISISNLR